MSRAAAALAAVLVLAGCSVPGTVQARAFSTGFKAGQTIRYRVHTTVAGSLSLGSQQVPLNSDQVVTEKLRVISVDRSGTADLELSIENLIDQATGAPQTQPPAQLTVGPDGRIRSGAGAQLGGRIPSIPGNDQLTPVLPGRPVKPGDLWSADYERPNPYGGGSIHFAASAKYVRDESVGGRQAAVIDSTLQGPVDFTIDFSRLPANIAPTPSPVAPVHYTGTISTTTRFWVGLDDDQVLKSDSTGAYNLSYAVVAPATQPSGPQQVAFVGQIKTTLSRL